MLALWVNKHLDLGLVARPTKQPVVMNINYFRSATRWHDKGKGIYIVRLEYGECQLNEWYVLKEVKDMFS